MGMRRGIPAAVVLAVLLHPATAEGQTSVAIQGGWWDWAGSPGVDWQVEGRVVIGSGSPAPRRTEVVYVEPRYDVVYAPRGKGKKRSARSGNQPFCASGQGHPAHGWRWCADRGWVRAQPRYATPRSQWVRVDSRDIWFYDDYAPIGRTFGPRGLHQILGDQVMEDLYQRAHYLGARGALEGRWVQGPDRRSRVLQVRAGNTPLAEFTDRNGDWRVDTMLVAAAW